MFAAKLSCLTALALAPWAQALLMQLPVGWQSSSPANISWSSVATDSPFTLQLANTNEFHDTFSIANNVNPSAHFASFTLPVVPQGTYTLRAINPTNAGQIFDQTPSFTIQGPPVVSSPSSAASTSARGSATLALQGTSKIGASGTAAGSSAGRGVTRSNPASPAINTGAAPASTGRGSSTAGARSGFNNGAASLSHLAPWAIAALGAIAGAVVVL